MQIKTLAGAMLVAAVASIAACTTKPVVLNTPGPGVTVVQVPVPATPDITLTNRVRTNLQASLGSNAAGIDVRVEEGTVYLTGRVATQALHDKAVAVVRGTPDVRGVVHTGLIVSS